MVQRINHKKWKITKEQSRLGYFLTLVLVMALIIVGGSPTALATYKVETGFVTITVSDISEKTAFYLGTIGNIVVAIIFVYAIYKGYPTIKNAYRWVDSKIKD